MPIDRLKDGIRQPGKVFDFRRRRFERNERLWNVTPPDFRGGWNRRRIISTNNGFATRGIRSICGNEKIKSARRFHRQ